jgi:2-polyprenyl-3-methyl-5-hydroxy-6-metoxy-1,4-benzoquinol methylase
VRRRPHRVDVDAIAREHLEAGDPVGWFEPVYRAARWEAGAIPWVGQRPHPYVLDWLDAPVAPPPGDRAVVVGCGLGDDAAALARRGFATTAFDVAPSAVKWARRRFLRSGIDWRVQDVLDLPEDLVGAFDLVVEVRTVQSLPGVVRDAAMQAVASLAAPGGIVLVVALLATSSEHAAGIDGPPWPQAPAELAAYRAGGLEQLALEHPDPDEDGVLEARITWRRPGPA